KTFRNIHNNRCIMFNGNFFRIKQRWQHTHDLDTFVIVHHANKSCAQRTIVLVDNNDRHFRYFPLLIHMPYQYTVQNRCPNEEHHKHTIVEKELKLALNEFYKFFHVLILSIVLEEQPMFWSIYRSPLHDRKAPL